ncbi:hypothetical protein [Microbispora sp. ATCC PTA-5024]|uniref:hypothetical protein n=1 Tax=Microbispora sp. ATCC PTA-5024 TaxID=316330 RepID=UPI0003DC73F3|nr:hypothetical protein [Microbispora sp. ATCC PTA-5024]ETK35746.1 hypothetical protein MPTA5024_12555 [Microbispora sp. ATCC PTA-5024]
MKQTGGVRVTRRALLGTAAAAGLAASGCSSRPATPPPPARPDPQAVLLASLIRGKEQLVALYQRAELAGGAAARLEPFRQRHVAHLTALRTMLPRSAASSPHTSSAPAASPASPGASAAASPDSSPDSSPDAVPVAALRDAERRAAAGRAAQMAGASPALAQLLASIGACEAVHVIALGRLRD